MKKWGKHAPGGDIFSVEKLFFPIHCSSHWFLVVACMKQKVIQSYDSLGSGQQKVLSEIKSYLRMEHESKKKTELPKEWCISHSNKSVPLQTNCKLFHCLAVFQLIMRNSSPEVFSYRLWSISLHVCRLFVP